MAIEPKDLPNAVAPSAAYPQGSFKDESAAGALDGTALVEDWPNDIYGFLQALLASGGITPSGVADTALVSDYKDALNAIYARLGSANLFTALLTIQGLSQGLIIDRGGPGTSGLKIKNNTVDADIVVNAGFSGSPLVFDRSGVGDLLVSSIGAILAINTGGLGYGAGSGGTVTQATSKATGVTLNKPTGKITMNPASLAAGASAEFTVTNSILTFNDTVSINQSTFAINTSAYTVEVTATNTGAFAVRLTNITAGALADAVVLTYTITKGAEV